jgi:D-alanyl-D-alanine carboxypeptidase
MPDNAYKKYYLFLMVTLLILTAGVSTFALTHDTPKPKSNQDVKITQVNPFDKLSVEAKQVFVYDMKERRVIYSKNAEEIRPLASLAKVMTAYTSLETSKDEVITIPHEALAREGDSGLVSREKWNWRDLLDFTLITSSNDGAAALALSSIGLFDNGSTQASFVEKMNLKAKGLGLNSLTFYNETGLDVDPDTSGAYGSAKEIGLLFSHVLENHPDILEATKYSNYKFTSIDGVTHSAKNTDIVVNKIPGLIASKTGYTDLAGGNLVIAFDSEIAHPIVVVVMGSSIDGRFTDMVTIASTTRAYLATK